jgi:uncharacterized membrane protein YdjX (TVP38/TMEM64 family)
MKRFEIGLHIIVPMVLAGLSILLLLPYRNYFTVENIVSFTPSSILLAGLVLTALFALKTLVVVMPMSVLYIVAGIALPTGWAFLVTVAGLTISASIGYAVGKFSGEGIVQKAVSKNKKAERLLVSSGNLASLCFVARVSPLPFELVSLFCGALNMPFVKYIIVSLLGLAPFMVPCVLVGNAIFTPLTAEFLLPFSISMIVSGVSFILYLAMTKRNNAFSYSGKKLASLLSNTA